MDAPKLIRLAELCGSARFIAARDAARVHASQRQCSVYVVRTPQGFRCSIVAPVMGEHWKAEPSGDFTHVPGPVI